MARCQLHRISEPCYYCERGLPSFEHFVQRIEILETRLRALELCDRSLLTLDIPKSIGVVRMGGLGDLAMLSSSLKALKAKDPDRALVLVTRAENMGLFADADYLDALLPVESWAEAGFKRRYDLRYAVEPPGIGSGKLPWQDYMTKDRSDIFDELLGVKSTKQFSIAVNPGALEKMEVVFKGLRRPLIGLAPLCKSAFRAIPPEYVEPLSRRILQKTTGTVVLMGKTTDSGIDLSNIRTSRIINLIDTLSVAEFVAAIRLMDAVIAPDTSTTHIAGALGTPCLALFGNIHPKTRVTYYPSVHALYPKGELPCIPCWDKSHPCRLSPGKHGADCMRLLTPERIVAALRENFLKVAA